MFNEVCIYENKSGRLDKLEETVRSSGILLGARWCY